MRRTRRRRCIDKAPGTTEAGGEYLIRRMHWQLTTARQRTLERGFYRVTFSGIEVVRYTVALGSKLHGFPGHQGNRCTSTVVQIDDGVSRPDLVHRIRKVRGEVAHE